MKFCLILWRNWNKTSIYFISNPLKMKKIFMLALVATSALLGNAAVADYDQAAALQKAQADVANWQSYLPDNVFVAHVSFPGTHDTATADGWISSTGSTYSTTQTVNIDNQLLQGIRAFDFRPGLKDGKLHCNHGTDETKLTLEQGFTKLTDYLDAHPTEFFVIHLFRGNVPNAGTSLTGGKNSDSDRETYNNLVNEFFNQGKFAEYIVDWKPTLKVSDMRGKMVVFRRDRIEFAHIAKAGNLYNWPSDSDPGTENQNVTIINATNPIITGTMHVTDISSPDDQEHLDIELASLTGIFQNCSTQGKPNDLKQSEGFYKPTWYMPFTSGCYGKMTFNIDTSAGYLANATHTNPHFTKLLRDAQSAGTAGPCGIVLSDYVLVDSYNNKAPMGIDLVKAIWENNFYYIKDFILDDTLFTDDEDEPEEPIVNAFDSSKWYYMRNVATGEFLNGGFWWGTHAALRPTPDLKVQPKVNTTANRYFFATDRTNGSVTNHLGGIDDPYVDNNGGEGNAALYQMIPVGENKYVFKGVSSAGASIALGAEARSAAYGSDYLVGARPLDMSDPMQQWELIECEQYYQNDMSRIPPKSGIDLTYVVGAVSGNNPSNALWNINTKNGGSLVNKGITADGGEYTISMLSFTNAAKSGWSSNKTQWSASREFTGLPNGRYQFIYNEYFANHSDIKVTVTCGDYKNEYTCTSYAGTSGTEGFADAINAFKTGNCKQVHDVTVTDGKITFSAACTTNHGSAVGAFFGDFQVLYFGDASNVALIAAQNVQEAIDELTAFVETLPANCTEDFTVDINPYQEAVNALSIEGDGSKEVAEIKELKRKYLYRNTVEGADFTEAIENHSFETGTTAGWTVIASSDTGVYPNSNGTYATDGVDGKYLFNTWWQGTPLTQIIPALPSGKYRLEVLMASGDGDAGATPHMFLLANGTRSDVFPLSKDKTKFQNLAYDFDVAGPADVEIGVIGGDDNGEYVDGGHWWYKADNFRLTYLSKPDMTRFYDALQAAIDEATATVNTLDATYAEGWTEDIAPYQAIVDNKTLDGDGTQEIANVYALMQKHILAQDYEGADLTLAILNNSFERNDLYGWTAETFGDTGTRENANGTYHVDNADGDYIYNTWNQDGWGADIQQTISGLRAGVYELTALLTTDPDYQVQLFANDVTNVVTSTSKTLFESAKVHFAITADNGEVTFGARHLDRWFKADNFVLTYVAPYKELYELAYPVTEESHLVSGQTYFIVAELDSALHSMGSDEYGSPVLTDGYGKVSHTAKAQLYTIEQRGSDFVLVKPQVEEPALMLMAAADEATLKVNLTPGEQATVTDETGNALGYHPTARTFGFTEEHTSPAFLYTSPVNVLTGIESVDVENSHNEPAVYYNLQGVRVLNPTRGLYIRKAGNKVEKIIL